jgi:hypothetical protein
MSSKTRWIALAIAAGLIVGAGAYFAVDHAGASLPAASGLPAASRRLTVRCDESVLTSCLEKLPSTELPVMGTWPDEQSPTIPQFVAQMFGGTPAQQQQTAKNLQGEGLEAVSHEVYQSTAGDGPAGDIIVMRFASPQQASYFVSVVRSNWASSTTGAPPPSTSVSGLPGSVYLSDKLNDEGYETAKYGAAAGNLVMQVMYGSYETFNKSDFAVSAGGEYLTLESAHTPTP